MNEISMSITVQSTDLQDDTLVFIAKKQVEFAMIPVDGYKLELHGLDVALNCSEVTLYEGMAKVQAVLDAADLAKQIELEKAFASNGYEIAKMTRYEKAKNAIS